MWANMISQIHHGETIPFGVVCSGLTSSLPAEQVPATLSDDRKQSRYIRFNLFVFQCYDADQAGTFEFLQFICIGLSLAMK